MAEFGWIDFSPTHRRSIGAILDAFGTEGMVDELGIGIIRDALADQLFPGINTIQTRAKYFFLVPYILYEYQCLSPARRRNISPEDFLKKRENETMWALAEKYPPRGKDGVIGITKHKPQTLIRRPSAIYWHGLEVYGFIKHGGLGIESFLRQCQDGWESLMAEAQGDDEENKDTPDAEYESLFRLRVTYDKNWSDNLSMDLTRNEANQLSDRMVQVGEGKLVGELLSNADLQKTFFDSESFQDFAKAAQNKSAPESIKKLLVLSHDFSELMYGAHIAYNCRLQKQKFNRSHHAALWKEWAGSLKESMIDYAGFTPEKLLEVAPNVKSYTWHFIEAWWDYIKSEKNDVAMRDSLIENQERFNKKGKARICWNKTEDVMEEGWLGLERLEYRIYQAQRILDDIIKAQK